MPDHFVFFAVLLVLPIVALLRFVGCTAILGIEQLPLPGPHTVTVSSRESGALAPLGTRTFDAIASWDSNAKIDKWEVQSTLPKKGAITAEGKYTAPGTISGPSEEQVVAHAKDGTVDFAGSLTVHIVPPSAKSVDGDGDSKTGGDWKDIYGKEGWALAGGPPNDLPDFLPVLNTAPLVVSPFADPTTDKRALQKPPAYDTRFAAAWSDASGFSLDFNFTDFDAHRVSIYCVDWDDKVRAQEFEFLDISHVPPARLDTLPLASFVGGQYRTWDLSGHVRLRVTRTSGPDAVISGIFFDPVP